MNLLEHHHQVIVCLSNILVYDQNTCKTNGIPINLSCNLCIQVC